MHFADHDPEKVELTPENAESPSLLGGVQILVDGGKLIFKRLAPTRLDPGFVVCVAQQSAVGVVACDLCFSNALGFDAVVVPRLGDENLAGYTTEEQAADLPQGTTS